MRYDPSQSPAPCRRMLADRNMILCILISTLLVAFLLVFVTFTPLYLLNVRGFSHVSR